MNDTYDTLEIASDLDAYHARPMHKIAAARLRKLRIDNIDLLLALRRIEQCSEETATAQIAREAIKAAEEGASAKTQMLIDRKIVAEIFAVLKQMKKLGFVSIVNNNDIYSIIDDIARALNQQWDRSSEPYLKIKLRDVPIEAESKK